MKSWHHLLWATVALGALFVALQAVQAWKASMTSELTQKANNTALQSQLDALKAERQAAVTPEQQAQLVGRYLAPIWQRSKPIQVTMSKPTSGGEGTAPKGESIDAGQAPKAYPDAPSASLKKPPENFNESQAIKIPDTPGEFLGGDLYVPPDYMSAFADHESQCKQDALSLTTCKANLATANKAAKGGGFWGRLKANARWFAIGGAAGAAAVAIGKH